MSTTAPTDSGNLDIKEQIVRIDRMIAESRKFSAEQNKLAEEASKLKRDRFFIPLLAASALGGVIVTGLNLWLRYTGVLH